MSELNFEAIGRCEHLRKEIVECLAKRDMHAQRVSYAAKTTGSSFMANTITSVGITKIENSLQELKAYDSEVRTLVEEYNLWATKAGKDKITFMGNGR